MTYALKINRPSQDQDPTSIMMIMMMIKLKDFRLGSVFIYLSGYILVDFRLFCSFFRLEVCLSFSCCCLVVAHSYRDNITRQKHEVSSLVIWVHV